MSEPRTAAIVLAAGQGTRMESRLPKVLHPLAGRPMINHVLDALAPIGCDPLVTVISPGMDEVARAVAPSCTAIQVEPRGTAHAALAARQALDGFDGDILVLYGDAPLITSGTLERLLERRRTGNRPAIVVLGMRPGDPAGYGRLIQDSSGELVAVVEHRDASPEQRRIGLCNGGVMVVEGRHLFGWLAQVDDDNPKREYYLPAIVALARRSGQEAAIVEAPPEEALGVNSRAELALAESVLQDRLRARAMSGGATLVDPSSVFLCHDTRIGRDVVIGPNVVFGPGVAIGDEVRIHAFCHIAGAEIESGAEIGPFARLRPGSRLRRRAKVGNFVELKNAELGEGAKANHLSYLGDAGIGAGTNVGAGTITCNYDGFTKSRTEIGAGAFIGSNAVLVAPVRVGDGAYVAAGSVVTRDVSPDALALARGRQVEKPGRAAAFRQRRKAGKSPGEAEPKEE